MSDVGRRAHHFKRAVCRAGGSIETSTCNNKDIVLTDYGQPMFGLRFTEEEQSDTSGG
jgi:hypothetical protein